MKLLIDTNVILDALMNREPWAKPAQDLILNIAEGAVEGYITASTFTDIYYILNKHIKNKEHTKQALISLIAIVGILDVNGIDCEKAFGLPMSDYEDALLVYCGKRHKIDYIVTRNIKHFAGSPVKAISPGELLIDLQEGRS